MAFKLKWYGKQVRKLLNQNVQSGIEEVAYEMRQNARDNIEANGQIDTRFMYQSVYVATPHGHTPIHPSGIYRSLKGHGLVRRNLGEIVQVDEGAYLGVAASYALWAELKQPFLTPAIEDTRGRQAEKILSGFHI